MPSDHDITGLAVHEAIRIHRQIGPGAFERAYAEFLAAALSRRGLRVQRELTLPASFEGVMVPLGHRLDLLVNERVIIEVKSTELHHPVHVKQVLTYLRLSTLRTGLLLNFGMERMLDGVHRIVNGWE